MTIEDKWLATIEAKIGEEIERVIQTLVTRLRQLDDRYTTPLPDLEREVSDFSDKVEAHLKQMGLSW